MKKDQKYFMRRCRLCGKCHNGSYDIFSFKDRNLKELIHECLHINVREDDALPKKLCQFCDKKLSLWEKFKNSCENIQIKLIADSLPKKVDIPKNSQEDRVYDGSECISADDQFVKRNKSKKRSKSPCHKNTPLQSIEKYSGSDADVLKNNVNNGTGESSCPNKNNSPSEDIPSNPVLKQNLDDISVISLSLDVSSKFDGNCNLSDEVLKTLESPTKVSQISDQDIKDLNDTLSKNICSDNLKDLNDTLSKNLCSDISFCSKVIVRDTTEGCVTVKEKAKSNITLLPLMNETENSKITKKSTAKEYHCAVCSESFSSLRKMKIHRKEHYSQSDQLKRRTKSPKDLQCPQCPRKLSTAFNLRHHLDTHSETCNYCCHLCGKLFRTQSSLSNHIRVHMCDELEDPTRENSSSVRLFQCEICDKKFRQRGHLAYHLKTHTGIRLYNCTECELSFAEKYQLRKHQDAVHNKVKRYTCDVCGKQFLHTHNFRDHKLQHEGIANISCDLCGKAFVTNNALSRHQRLHSGVKPFACEICGKQFRDCSNRKRHQKKHTEEERRGFSIKEEGPSSNLLPSIVEEIFEAPDDGNEEGQVKKTYMNLKTYFESNDDVTMREEAKGEDLDSVVTSVSGENLGLLQPVSNIEDSSNPLLSCGLFGEEMEGLLLIGDGSNGMIGESELQDCLKDQLVWVPDVRRDECLTNVCGEDLDSGEVGLGEEMSGGGDISGILEVGMGLCGDFDVTSGIDLDSGKDDLPVDFPLISEIKEVEENEKAFENMHCLQVF